MRVYDEVTKDWVDRRFCKKIVLQRSPNFILYGYTSNPNKVVKIMFRDFFENVYFKYTDPTLFKGELLFSKKRGIYFAPEGFKIEEIYGELFIKGAGEFPYSFSRKYEAIENFDKFEGKQFIKDNSIVYDLSKYLHYTFGLEFETSQGYIPEDICYRDGLIPLRDGSIAAPEYSTVVLKGNDGIALLHQQIETLKEYTNFNKECSLHVHLGGYPLDPDKLFNLYQVCKNIEYELTTILPKLTFNSSLYKSNGKDYCKFLEKYVSFDDMYRKLVGRRFFGSFTQAHPADVERKRKWNVEMRYFWCNFINALCYNVNKTIEFRFLRPTYNFKKIILWLYIFNAILKYAETYNVLNTGIDLSTILKSVYPEELYNTLYLGICKLKVLTINQQNNGDEIGAEVWMEDELFNDLNI